MFLSSLLCSSHVCFYVKLFFINYSFAVCLIWQGEPLICSSVLEFGYVWTFILSYAVWNTCQVLNKVLEI